jgi:hypothetical protein
MSRVAVRPYLVAKDAEGRFRITVNTTRFNSQGYPLVSSAMLDEAFPSAMSARAHVRERFGAVPTDIATKVEPKAAATK